jgi:ABC-type dipeptide/oligopeptide/nickel transport system permease subunit
MLRDVPSAPTGQASLTSNGRGESGRDESRPYGRWCHRSAIHRARSRHCAPIAFLLSHGTERGSGGEGHLLVRLDPTGLAGAALLALIVVACLAAPLLAPSDPLRIDLPAQLQGPSATHPLGTDNFGRDVWARMLHGGRVSLAVAAGATLISLLISLVLGGLAGYVGGIADDLVMRAVDLTLAFPRLVLAITIAGLLGAGLSSVIIAIVVVSWAWYARVVRGMVLQAREEAYVLAAHALGASSARILLRHLLPTIAGQVAVLTSLDFGRIILAISALSFLGLGIRSPVPEWGAMLNESRLFFALDPRLMLVPGLAIFLTVLAANLLSDALRDALDPRHGVR